MLTIPTFRSLLQARIVAYSDSDEEDFNKHHRTVPAPSGEEGAAEASAEEEAAEGSSVVRVRRPAPGSVVRIGRNGAFAAAQSSLVPAAQAALAQLTPQNAVRVSLLTLVLMAWDLCCRLLPMACACKPRCMPQAISSRFGRWLLSRAAVGCSTAHATVFCQGEAAWPLPPHQAANSEAEQDSQEARAGSTAAPTDIAPHAIVKVRLGGQR